MARFQRRPFRQQRSPQRKTAWIQGPDSVQVSTLAGNTCVLFASFDTRASNLIDSPFTIVRTRGLFSVIDVAVDTAFFPFGAFGAVVVGGEAFDAGVASLPCPYSEAFFDRWLVHQYWSTANIISTGVSHGRLERFTIDSRAMRKVETGDVICFLVENGSNTEAITFQLDFRQLVKLH